ncbi:MAG: hypothetical protein M3R38_09280 [Actinomycetota bacterium]|nr:hypothetical protein [Actinomycetota bacterium]
MPPPVPDPLPKVAAGVVTAGAVVAAGIALGRRRLGHNVQGQRRTRQ